MSAQYRKRQRRMFRLLFYARPVHHHAVLLALLWWLNPLWFDRAAYGAGRSFRRMRLEASIPS